MDQAEFIISFLTIFISFPAIVLFLVILGQKHIIGLIGAIEEKLKKGEISSLKFKDLFEIEFIKIERSQLIEVSSPEMEALNTFSKSSYGVLPAIIEKAFSTRKMSKILNVDLSKNINDAALYLYVQRLSKYFDLRLLVFVNDLNFLGTIGVKEFLYVFESNRAIYKSAYEKSLASEGEELLHIWEEQGEANLEQRESCLIDTYNSNLIDITKKYDVGEKLTPETFKGLFNQHLDAERFETRDKLAVDDLLEVLHFDSDFIPITKKGIYQGVVEKNHFVQLIIANFLQKSGEKGTANEKKATN